MVTTRLFPPVWVPWIFMSLLAISLRAPHAGAAEAAAVAGTFSGTLGASLDSPDQGALGIPCTDVHLDAEGLSFRVPSVHGSWEGRLADSARRLEGTWDQGTPQKLDFLRDDFEAAATPSGVDGIWLGTLAAGAQRLRIQVTVKSDRAGEEFCSLDSIDQGAFGLDCANAAFSARHFEFDVPVVHGHWTGELHEDGRGLSGTWTQGGNPLPLNFSKQSKPWSRAPATYDPARAPADVAHLKAVLDADIAPALRSGALSKATSGGVTIGVLHAGERRVFSYARGKPDALYEIGSITKTFTGLILAQFVEQGLVTADEPVRALLPPDVVPASGSPEISLLDLVTQHSGLPRLPDNLRDVEGSNPYADYRPADLYRYLAARGLQKADPAQFLYSNLGLGLLGQVLANRAQVSYAELLVREVTAPLAMRDTVIALSAQQRARMIAGHSASHDLVNPWDFDALAGAGAIRSTAGDMLIYLAAELHPDQIAVARSASDESTRTLAAAIKRSQVPQVAVGGGNRIAFAWFFNSASGSYWHSGATGGYSAYASFNPAADFAAIVLMNTSPAATGSFADRLAEHIWERFTGKPAISLGEAPG
jgi:CubicO group peptidase (beta-lactamase class C family)